VMVLLMAVHSQLEYPLWYAHFLLPTTFALGLCLAGTERRSVALRAEDPTRQPPVRTMLMAALVGLAFSLLAIWDYQRVVHIFKPEAGAEPLAQRIIEGRQSWFFAHHADYAAVTTAKHPSTFMPSFDRAAHHLLDARLLRAWAEALDETNQVDRSRHVAQRLAEFRNPAAAAFFEVCSRPPTAGAAAGAASADPIRDLAEAHGLAPPAASASGLALVDARDAAPGLRLPTQVTPRSASGSASGATLGAGQGLQPPAVWVDMAASFPAAVSPANLPKGPPALPADPAFAGASSKLPFQCLKPDRVLSFKDFR
jgi:hypothetical protein